MKPISIIKQLVSIYCDAWFYSLGRLVARKRSVRHSGSKELAVSNLPIKSTHATRPITSPASSSIQHWSQAWPRGAKLDTPQPTVESQKVDF